jgi:hypothetical protein
MSQKVAREKLSRNEKYARVEHLMKLVDEIRKEEKKRKRDKHDKKERKHKKKKARLHRDEKY